MASPSPSTVVLIRVWLDEGRVRGRVLFEDDDDELGASAAAASIEELCEIARAALERWRAGN